MIDFHTHTRVSYCASKALTLESYRDALRRNAALEAVCVTDHGSSLYFPEDVVWSWRFIGDDSVFDRYRDAGNLKLAACLDALDAFAGDGVVPGLEVEMSMAGRLVYDPAFRPRAKILIGSVHALPIDKDAPADRTVADWLRHTFMLLNRDIDILGHPFRWLNTRTPVTRDIIAKVVDEAARTGVALEVNSHSSFNDCFLDAIMVREAAERGAKIAFGTDAHELHKVGEFAYHWDVLRRAEVSLEELKTLTLPAGAPEKKKRE